MSKRSNSDIRRKPIKDDIAKPQKPKQYYKSYAMILVICFVLSIIVNIIILMANGESFAESVGMISYLYDLGISFIVSAVIYAILKSLCPQKMK